MTNDTGIIECFVKPHEIALRKMHDEALFEMNNGGLRISSGRIYGRVKAAYLNNAILEKAKPYFKNIEGIQVDDRYDSLALSCADCGIIGKFKKAPKNFYPANPHPTNRTQSFIQGLLFDNHYRKTSLEITYTVNSIWTEYVKICVIKRIDRSTAIFICEIAPVEEFQQPETYKKAEERIFKLPEQEKQITIKKTKNDH